VGIDREADLHTMAPYRRASIAPAIGESSIGVVAVEHSASAPQHSCGFD
jgi:hypothetical protein